MGDLEQFNELKDNLYAKLDKAKSFWETIGGINQKLGTIYKGASSEYGLKAEDTKVDDQPGAQD